MTCNARVTASRRVSSSERSLRDLGASEIDATEKSDAPGRSAVARVCPSVVFRLLHGEIQDVRALPTFLEVDNGKTLPIDAVSVGHYVGVRPQAAELAIDKAISRAIADTDRELSPSELILTQFTDRGLLRGDLGTTFFLPIAGATDSVLAVAGMGPVGACGAPELTIVVRELCWALSRYGKKHLATLLIGSGNGNLSVRQCVEAWIRGRLLIPHDLGPQLSSTAPLVLQVDSTTARIHWEMVSQPDPVFEEDVPTTTGDMSGFLGTYRGLTRQLRTTFARPPQPARNHQAVPRVLVVADPSRDHPLVGAAEEGLAVAALLENFNAVAEHTAWPQRFQVTRLIGPLEATPTRVLRELTVRRYEVLHYAGHCFFDQEDPAMYLAMLRARLAIAQTSSGRGTWGAYQHYGNPNYRILSARAGT